MVYCSIMCRTCVKGGKMCLGLDGLPCSQCMHNWKPCRVVVVESKLGLLAPVGIGSL